MQIKRFEAADMTAALNLVKETFGSDAVILSARSIKRNAGLFGLLHKSGVEVTAAIDSPKSPGARPSEVRNHRQVIDFQKVGTAPADGTLPAAIGGTYTPFRRSGPIRVQAGIPRPTPGASGAELRRILSAHGVREELIRDLIQRLPLPEAAPTLTPRQALTAALADAIEAKGIGAPIGAPSRIIALVGPTGVGKTTAAAKIAAQHAAASGRQVGLISCDFRKIAADAEIGLYAQILGVPLACAWNPEAMTAALARMHDRDLVIIDTPGVSPGHHKDLAALGEMLAIAEAQTHLLLSAAAKPGDLEKTLDRFSPLDIQRLAFTRLDETENHGALINLPAARRIPLSWISFGPQVPEALRPAAAPDLAQILIDPLETMEKWRGRSVWVVAAPSTTVAAAERPTGGGPTARYIANRKSGIFHRQACHLARTIKPEHRILLDSPRASETQQLQPCQSCRPTTTPPNAAGPAASDHPEPTEGRLRA